MPLTADYLSLSSSFCFFRVGEFNSDVRFNLRRRRVGNRCCKASLITNSDSFEVGKLIGSYGFMNITSYSGLQSSIDMEYFPGDIGRLRAQDVGEGSVKIRLYEGRIAQGPLRGTSVIFKVYPGQRVGGLEADLMAANELGTHASLQNNSKSVSCPNIQILLGGFETRSGEQWLAFKNDGKYTAADYTKFASEKMSKYSEVGGQKFWNPFEKDETIKRRRYFVTKLLQGIISGLAYMHDNDRLHQSLGPASIVLNTMVEKDAMYLVPKLRDLAFSVDIRFSELEGNSNTLSDGLWRRASASGAFTPMEKRAFGIADDIYEAGLLLSYVSFIPFCEAGVMDSLSLRRLLENTFRLDVQAMREYCLADDRLLEAVRFLDLGNGAGWELLQAMLNRDFRQRPIAEAVLNHRFMAGAFPLACKCCIQRLALKRLIDVSMGVITPLSEQLTKRLPNMVAMVTLKELSSGAHKLLPEGTRLAVSVCGDEPYEELEILKSTDATMILHHVPYSEEKTSRVHAARRDDLVIGAGTNAGALLVDGLGDGILLEAPDQDFEFLRNTSFNLLQGCRMRNTKTEYVSCPSCGRTLFDLQEISAVIREKTSHLPGVSIAIMGCIVNGPGEMADADFGYVGGAPGKIDLYVGKTVVKRAIAMEHATDALIDLIKEHGRWVDPPTEE